ncbi:SDR family NAD(P)-dependent oxidoreductase [Neolewinella litorea]|uniref:SDR family oxidoreductase n=1 Tax=Neolewinella litorea TaxID=2562452 RepID=A0A4S4NLU1_9BACT|nr:SDR family oxidoreductase [Neolewinella litorea]THH39298.1 SDR family oxidoreductase [Neolewinella litorea]
MNAIITGASRGIGRACAETLSAAGFRVTAVARNEAQLRELQHTHPTVEPLVADLTREVPTGVYDVVILNAGYYAPGGLLDPGRDVFGESWELNVMANHRLARALLPPLVERGHGHLVVIGSSATDDTSGHMTAYGATKKCLRILYESWERELEGSGVRTTLVAPGATLTSSWAGETPPPKILQPTAVADLVLRCVNEGITGRVTIKA